MRFFLGMAAVFLLATFAPPTMSRPEPPPAVTRLSFTPVPMEEAAPRRVALGALHYLGGWHVRSNDHRFGGLSAMHVGARDVLALSDSGWLVRFPRPDLLPGPAVVELAQPAGPGAGSAKESRDSESLAVHGPFAWIGYEKANAVWRYRLKDWAPSGGAEPAAMEKWPSNGGSEAMLRLPDGRFLVFAEGRGGGALTEALLFSGDPASKGTRAEAVSYRPPTGYRLTDAALLPDGRVLFLNRRFRLLEGFSVKLVAARLPRLREGAEIGGREIAEFGGTSIEDNLEALSVTREEGRTIVWMASDDNFNPLQRSLLLKFELVG